MACTHTHAAQMSKPYCCGSAEVTTYIPAPYGIFLNFALKASLSGFSTRRPAEWVQMELELATEAASVQPRRASDGKSAVEGLDEHV